MSSNFAELSDYQQLIEGNYQEPSIYIAAVRHYIEQPTEELIRTRLEQVLARADVDDIVLVEKEEDYFRVVLRGNEQVYLFRIYIQDNVDSELWHYEAVDYCDRGVFEDERIEMANTPQTVECFCYLMENPVEYVMIQLAVLNAIAGESYAVFDAITANYFSGSWLAEMAESLTPPNPTLFFTIHAIGDRDDKDENNYWLHTHGLLKFGLPELEIVKGHKNSLYIYQNLINSTALQLFDDNQNWQQEKILVAYTENTPIYVSFKPWQEAITSNLLVEKKGIFHKKTIPFTGDLTDRDEYHSKPSLVIFANIDDHIQELSKHSSVLNDDNHMMTYLPSSETNRMASLASEKFNWIAECFTKHPPEADNWEYITKIYCPNQDDEDEYGEHMWFNLLEIDHETLKVELLNEPFNLPEFKAGEIYHLPISMMTDWKIYSSPWQTAIAPDDIFILRRYLRTN